MMAVPTLLVEAFRGLGGAAELMAVPTVEALGGGAAVEVLGLRLGWRRGSRAGAGLRLAAIGCAALGVPCPPVSVTSSVQALRDHGPRLWVSDRQPGVLTLPPGA
ncbi:hypothetical protein GCM10022419_090640 [Nonomuraea rosea]|uniref:Uncharacterized protein n=1 Tax=Nonomuraea rosea TaxID=638574 RepID=A0ABP6YZ64_9ACTN